MLCSVVGDDSDDRIRICLLCNFDVDSDDDEADVQKSDDDAIIGGIRTSILVA